MMNWWASQTALKTVVWTRTTWPYCCHAIAHQSINQSSNFIRKATLT
ncbi:MAG: hypothetical protein ABS942_00060 [Solibacillus sp.]